VKACRSSESTSSGWTASTSDPRHPLRPLRRPARRAVDLAVSVGEEPETVEDVYEAVPVAGGAHNAPRPADAVAAPFAYEHLGLAVPAQSWSSISAGDPINRSRRRHVAGFEAVRSKTFWFTAGTGEDCISGGPWIGRLR